MHLFGSCIVLSLLSPSLQAQPPQAAPPSHIALVADDRLRAWLATDPKVRETIKRAQDAAEVLTDTDRKDAVADQPSDGKSLQSGPVSPRQACQDFATCSTPPLAADLTAGESVETAIRALLQPWIWLADAKGVRLGVAPSSPGGQAVLAMNIQGLGLSGVELQIKPRPQGGVRLWFSRRADLAALYAREHAALQAHPAPPRP
jgi:hypothetical protein